MVIIYMCKDNWNYPNSKAFFRLVHFPPLFCCLLFSPCGWVLSILWLFLKTVEVHERIIKECKFRKLMDCETWLANFLFKPLSRPLTRCCVATAVLLDGYRHIAGWLPPHCWMATATLLDGYRHTIGWLPPHCSLPVAQCSLTLLVDYFKPYF